MIIEYWSDQVDLENVPEIDPDHKDTGIEPAECFKVVRETMEVLAYRTAMTYNDEGRPSLYYFTTLKGISCYEVNSRSNRLERVSISR